MDELFRVGKMLFDQFAPPEVKARYEFPTKERWDALVAKFQRALEGDSMADLAACAAEGREALGALFRDDRIDPLIVIRWKDIYEALERALDACETAANVIANIVVKNA